MYKTPARTRIYRGVPSQAGTLPDDLPLIPVTDELIQCPKCHGGVKLIPPPYTDDESGVTRSSKVYASHKIGGTTARGHKNKCAQSLALASV
jgi:hypothetical protein